MQRLAKFRNHARFSVWLLALSFALNVMLLWLQQPAVAQVVSSTIIGTVKDPTGLPVPGASVTVTDVATAAQRQAQTDQRGDFVFSGLRAGQYNIVVTAASFKTTEKHSVVLSAAQTLTVGEIGLQLGTLAETVTVNSQGDTVQASSSERSGVVTGTQMQNLTIASRDYVSLISLLPGVVAVPAAQPGASLGRGGNSLNVQGTRTSAQNFTIDGMSSLDLSGAALINAFISIDSVSEVRLLVSNYQPEFGRKAGANVQAITKSGSREFHGAAYWYKRHEEFNANNFFNNRAGIPTPLYRLTVAGGDIGGPIYIPGKFNRDRNKLFFFFGEEQLREARPEAIQNVTMPTAAERKGDFSASRDVNGALIIVKDPLTGQPFASNTVPASRINPLTQAYLNLLPLPNFFNTAVSGGSYNYSVQDSLIVPKHVETVRVDYNLGSSTRMYWRLTNWRETLKGWGPPVNNSTWGWLPNYFTNPDKNQVLSASHIFSPSLVLEVSGGLQQQHEGGGVMDQGAVDRLTKTKSGVTIPQFYPVNNTLNLVPNATFGGITGAVSTSIATRFPDRGADFLVSGNAVLTKIYRSHIFKTGIVAERDRDYEGNSGNFNGTFAFDRDVNDPNESNHPFANALLGNFTSYTESTTRPWTQDRATVIEGFVQDNWKIGPRLTVDYGIRLGWAQPFHDFRRDEAGFVPSRFSLSQRVTLIKPGMVGNQRVGVNPITGATLPVIDIGAVVPGVGDPFNGSVNLQVDRSYPGGLRGNSPLKLGPRFGFAYDPFGRGKTIIRSGFGMFFDMKEPTGSWSVTSAATNPPMQVNPVIYYGNLNTFTNSIGMLFPAATKGIDAKWPVEEVMNFSLGIQQKIGLGTVLDAAYVGSLGRHLIQGSNLNAIPFGADFLSANADPTSPGKPLSASFLRPYIGYGNITEFGYGGNSHYHSLQMGANRRFSGGLQFGSSWTWSKAMDYSDTETALVSSLINPKVWNYGKAGFDRTHVFTAYWMWDVPKASKVWQNVFARKVLDDWQLSGITTFQSGAPTGITLSFVNTTDITGSPTDTARVVVVANPILPKGQRTFSRSFNTAAFQAPAVGTFGNAANDVIRGPGMNNWDASVFKNIPLGERRHLQLRCELYNALNHTQFSAQDTTARFNAQGGQANPTFGQYTAARNPRQMQLALRFDF